MFTKEEAAKIDKRYFQMIQCTAWHIILKSKNTGHIWDIYNKEYPGGRSLVVNHKHSESDQFHIQPKMHPRSIQEAQTLIKDHDTWHINGRKE